MAKKKAAFRSTSRRLALEPRLLFDGAGAVAAADAAESVQDTDNTYPEPVTQAEEEQGQLTTSFEAQDPQASASPDAQQGNIEAEDNAAAIAAADQEKGAAAPAGLKSAATGQLPLASPMSVGEELGTLDGAKNTSDDGKVSVGEDDLPTAILKDWKITASGTITIEVSGIANGTLSSDNNGSLSFTGDAAAANAWLKGIRYQYKTEGQSQTGDTDTVKLTITDSTGAHTYTQTIDIAPQNDAPVVGMDGKVVLTVNEGGSASFGAPGPNDGGLGFTHALLGIDDPDNSARQVIIKIEAIPDETHGRLELTRSGQTIVLAVGSTLSVEELANLQYVHNGAQVDAKGSKTPDQIIRFTIDDGAGGRLTGRTVYIDLQPVNQPPTVAGGVTLVEGEQHVNLGLGGALTALRPDGTTKVTIVSERGKIEGVDWDDSTLRYTITALPTHGTLYYDGAELTVGTEITDLSKLTYSHDGSEPSAYGNQDTFKVSVLDNGGGTGTPSAPVETTVTLTILENNDDPVLVTNEPQDWDTLKAAGKVRSDSSFIITADMLLVTDADSFDKNLSFKITGLSDDTDDRPGYFTVGGKLLDVGTTFTMQDVIDGKVAYHLRTPSSEPRTDSFTFTVTDSDTGLLFVGDQAWQRDGGIYTSAAPNADLKEHTFSVTVPAAEPGSGGELPGLPDAATGFTINANKLMDGVLESEGTAADSGDGERLTKALLEVTDGVSPPEKIVYRLETVPTGGALWLDVGGGNWKQLNQFDSFTQADINGNKVVYRHHGGEQFADEFQFSVSNGDITTDALNTFQIAIVPQNDTPTASQGLGINVLEGESITINETHIVLSDSDRAGSLNEYDDDNELWFVVTKLPEHGDLYLDGTKLTAGAEITQEALADGKLRYEHRGDEQFKDSFKIRPYDDRDVGGASITPTNQSSAGTEVEIHITIAPVNDAPVHAATQHLKDGDEAKNGLYEGGKATIWGSNTSTAEQPYGQLVFTDSDNDKDQIQYRITTATQYGQLLLDDKQPLSVGSVFTQADLDAGRISYQHNGGQDHSDYFEYTVSDGDYRVNDAADGGVTGPGQTPAPARFEIQVKPSNDKPEFSSTRNKPLLVDGSDPAHNIITDIQIKDPDLPAGAENKEIDLVTVIVRVVGTDGKMLTGVDYSLKVDSVTGVTGTTTAGTTAGNGYLQLTGTVADINAALKTLGVGFAVDGNTKDYKLQVIVDDRLDAAGKAYQNGGAGVIANGGDKNQEGKELKSIDDAYYNWATAVVTKDTSLNLNVTEVELWVSTENDAPSFEVPSGITVQEDVPYKITGFDFRDEESETFGTAVEVTLAVNNGTLEARNLPDGVTVSGSGSSSITLRGSVTALKGYLNSADAAIGVFYTTASNVNHDTNGDDDDGDVTLTVTFEESAANENDPAAGGSAIGGDEGSGSQAHTLASKTVAITIDAINDAPTVTAPTGRLDIDSNDWIAAGTFTVNDVDADDGYQAGETDGTIKVVVRVLDKERKAFEEVGDYTGISFKSDNSTFVTVEGGTNGPLTLYGKKEDIQAYLDGLQVQFDSTVSDGANLDGTLYLEVLVDDRIYDEVGGVWKPTATANGGNQNQDGTPFPDDEWDAYTADPTSIYNVASATRELFISAVNDPAEVGFTDDTVTGLSATESNDNTVTLAGLKITDSDAQDKPLTVTIELPDGFTFASGPSGSKTIELTGTLDQLNAQFGDIKVQLPDVDGPGAIEAQDWNGSFTFKVTVNDHGNTGVTSATAPTGKNGNTFTVGQEEGGKNVLITTRDITFTVHPTNDAPVAKDGSGNTTGPGLKQTLGAVAEDFTNTGAPADSVPTVGDLFGQFFDDSRDEIKSHQNGDAASGKDTGSEKDSFWGVAVTGNAATAAQGEWQYWNGSTWDSIPTTVGDSSALLLGADTKFQFVPSPNWNGTPGDLKLRLVENNTNGDTTSSTFTPTSGATVNLTTSGGVGGTSLVSANTVVLGTSVTGVNDAPVANPDTHTINENQSSVQGGLIKQPTHENPGTTGSDTDVDTDPDLNKDPAVSEELTVSEVKYGPTVGTKDADTGVITVAGQYGTLTVNPDGSYTYTLNQADPEVNKLVAGQTLTEVFDYTIQDKGGKTAASKLEITITGDDDSAVGASITPVDGNGVVDGHATVHEKNLPGGSANSTADNQAAASGSINFTAGNGLSSITIAGIEVTLAQLQALDPSAPDTYLTIDVGHGTLVITGFTPDTDGSYTVPVKGSINYTYTLKAAQAHASGGGENSSTLDVSLKVTDAGDKEGTGTLTIAVQDDVPVAKADEATVDNGTNQASGNALTAGTTNTGDVKDVPGADGARVSTITGKDGSEVAVPAGSTGVTVEGQYGRLTIQPDGSYSYVRDGNEPLTADDVFTYTIVDTDGDTSTATITIHIDDQHPQVTTPTTPVPVDPSAPTGPTRPVITPNGQVHESGLPGGSDPTSGSNQTTGTIALEHGDGEHTVTITPPGGGTPVTLTPGASGTITTPSGEVTVTYNPGTGTDKPSITYEYELKTPTNGDTTTDEFDVTITDADGDSTTVTVVVDIVDDAPVAKADEATVDNGTNQASGNALTAGTTNTGDVKDVPGADGARVSTITGKDGSEVAVPAGSTGATVEGQYGRLTIQPDGSYSYVRDGNEPLTADDVFTYTIVDADGDTSTATITIHMDAAPAQVDPPVAPPLPPAPLPLPPGSATSSPASFGQGGGAHLGSYVPPPALQEGPRGLVSGDVAYMPGVFFGYGDQHRVIRIDVPLHPILYVTREVADRQAEQEQVQMLGTDVGLNQPGEVRSHSIGAHLGQDPALYVQRAVRESQQQGFLWERLARQQRGNLPPWAPEPAPNAASEAGIPESLRTAAPAEDAPATPARNNTAEAWQDAEATGLQALLMQRWVQDEPVEAEAAAQRASASGSFQQQLQTQACELPCRVG